LQSLQRIGSWRDSGRRWPPQSLHRLQGYGGLPTLLALACLALSLVYAARWRRPRSPCSCSSLDYAGRCSCHRSPCSCSSVGHANYAGRWAPAILAWAPAAVMLADTGAAEVIAPAPLALTVLVHPLGVLALVCFLPSPLASPFFAQLCLAWHLPCDTRGTCPAPALPLPLLCSDPGPRRPIARHWQVHAPARRRAEVRPGSLSGHEHPYQLPDCDDKWILLKYG